MARFDNDSLAAYTVRNRFDRRPDRNPANAKRVFVKETGRMGIRCCCPNGHKLNVKTEQAGKMGICPICKLRFQIPFGDAQTPTSSKSVLLQATPASSKEQNSTKETSAGSETATPQNDACAKTTLVVIGIVLGIFILIKLILKLIHIIFAFFSFILTPPIGFLTAGIVMAAFMLGFVILIIMSMVERDRTKVVNGYKESYGFWIGNSKEGAPSGYFSDILKMETSPHERAGHVYDGNKNHIGCYKFDRDYRKWAVYSNLTPLYEDPCIFFEDGNIYKKEGYLRLLATYGGGNIRKDGKIIAVYDGAGIGAAAAAALLFKWC